MSCHFDPGLCSNAPLFAPETSLSSQHQKQRETRQLPAASTTVRENSSYPVVDAGPLYEALSATLAVDIGCRHDNCNACMHLSHVPGPWSLFACCAETHHQTIQNHCAGIRESEIDNSASQPLVIKPQATVRGVHHGNKSTVESQCDTQSTGLSSSVGSFAPAWTQVTYAILTINLCRVKSTL